MNKNTSPICMFMMLLSIVTIVGVCSAESWDRFNRDMKLDRVERKIDDAMFQQQLENNMRQTEKNFKQIGQQFQQTSQHIVAQNQQAKKDHYNSIISVHPNYKKIAYGQEFPKWISSMPHKERVKAKDIVYRGTADEIIQLLLGFKGNYIPPILKRKRMVANSILGIKTQATKSKKDVGVFTAYTTAATNAIKNRYKIGMVNKKEVLLVLDDYDKLNRDKRNAEAAYYSKIAHAHPNYQEIISDSQFNEFITNLPEEERKKCNAIVDGGSAEEVIAVLSAYKQSLKREEREKNLKAAEQGNASAQNSLAFNYYTGDGVDQNYNEAAKWFLKAAGQKHVQSQFNLGYMYSKGQGVDQDYNKAVEWFRKAANQKYAHAQNMLGSMYSKGQGVDQDYEESVKWYRMAAEQGNKKAQKNLSAMYSEGRGVEKNEKEAVKWRLKSIE